MNLRWGVYEISDKWECFEDTIRNNFNVAMAQTSKKIKYQNVSVYQTY